MIKTIVFLVLVVLVLMFVIQNTQVVAFQFLAWKVSMSRALLLLGTFCIGIVVGWLSRRIKPKERKAS